MISLSLSNPPAAPSSTAGAPAHRHHNRSQLQPPHWVSPGLVCCSCCQPPAVRTVAHSAQLRTWLILLWTSRPFPCRGAATLVPAIALNASFGFDQLTSLNLKANNIVGTLPASMANLPGAASLALRVTDNQLTGAPRLASPPVCSSAPSPQHSYATAVCMKRSVPGRIPPPERLCCSECSRRHHRHHSGQLLGAQHLFRRLQPAPLRPAASPADRRIGPGLSLRDVAWPRAPPSSNPG